MNTRLVLVMALGCLACVCHAEPRWCSVVGKDPSNKFFYPPIARAARVSGVVLSRMIYLPNGKVQRVEPVLGPRLLSDSLTGELMNWIVKTNATGNELCQTLVIAEFMIRDSYDVAPIKEQKPAPAILRLSVEVDSIPIDTVIIDPAPVKGLKLVRLETEWRLKRAFRKLFGTH